MESTTSLAPLVTQTCNVDALLSTLVELNVDTTCAPGTPWREYDAQQNECTLTSLTIWVISLTGIALLAIVLYCCLRRDKKSKKSWKIVAPSRKVYEIELG
jgi:hypothetical protein